MILKVAITGGTGFVGRSLTKELISRGHEVFILTRNIQNLNQSNDFKYVQWLNEGDAPEKELEGIDVIVNLAGESINGRWTEKRKQKILSSRISATKEVLRICESLKKKPHTLINASAVGYYGVSRTKKFTENTSEAGKDFLAKTVEQWEHEASKAEKLKIRTVYCRFGIILDKKDGALPRIAMPYKLFAGGTLGTGNQWVSWIHLIDTVNGIIFVMKNNSIKGPVNFTAPNPVIMKEFGQTLGKILQRPHWIPAPQFALKALLGEMSLLVLEGQQVIPVKLSSNGFPFKFEHLNESLIKIYQ